MKTVELKALEVMEINVECRNIIEIGGNEAGYQKVFQITGGAFREKASAAGSCHVARTGI